MTSYITVQFSKCFTFDQMLEKVNDSHFPTIGPKPGVLIPTITMTMTNVTNVADPVLNELQLPFVYLCVKSLTPFMLRVHRQRPQALFSLCIKWLESTLFKRLIYQIIQYLIMIGWLDAVLGLFGALILMQLQPLWFLVLWACQPISAFEGLLKQCKCPFVFVSLQA